MTAVGNGATNSNGGVAGATGIGGPCPHVELVLRNSILRGFDNDLVRTATSIGCSGAASADTDVAFSVFDPGSLTESAAGAITTGRGNRNVNPRFANQAAGNFHLKASSPVIDRGQPGKPKPGESKVDLDGRKRVLDGDGNGKARRDIGAFERRAKRR